MKVILTEKVKALGDVGEVVKVAEGFGRNYLLPKKFAVMADEGNKKQLADYQKRLGKKVEAEKNAAEELKAKINGITLDYIKKVGTNGKLFGTVTTTELAKDLESKGFQVERRQIIIEAPIKTLGTFDVKVKLFKGVEAAFKVKIEIDPLQVEELKKMQAEAKKFKEEAKLREEAEAKAAAEAEEAAKADA
jgi:large subunit ribosomal protein L9